MFRRKKGKQEPEESVRGYDSFNPRGGGGDGGRGYSDDYDDREDDYDDDYSDYTEEDESELPRVRGRGGYQPSMAPPGQRGGGGGGAESTVIPRGRKAQEPSMLPPGMRGGRGGNQQPSMLPPGAQSRLGGESYAASTEYYNDESTYMPKGRRGPETSYAGETQYTEDQTEYMSEFTRRQPGNRPETAMYTEYTEGDYEDDEYYSDEYEDDDEYYEDAEYDEDDEYYDDDEGDYDEEDYDDEYDDDEYYDEDDEYDDDEYYDEDGEYDDEYDDEEYPDGTRIGSQDLAAQMRNLRKGPTEAEREARRGEARQRQDRDRVGFAGVNSTRLKNIRGGMKHVSFDFQGNGGKKGGSAAAAFGPGNLKKGAGGGGGGGGPANSRKPPAWLNKRQNLKPGGRPMTTTLNQDEKRAMREAARKAGGGGGVNVALNAVGAAGGEKKKPKKQPAWMEKRGKLKPGGRPMTTAFARGGDRRSAKGRSTRATKNPNAIGNMDVEARRKLKEEMRKKKQRKEIPKFINGVPNPKYNGASVRFNKPVVPGKKRGTRKPRPQTQAVGETGSNPQTPKKAATVVPTQRPATTTKAGGLTLGDGCYLCFDSSDGGTIYAQWTSAGKKSADTLGYFRPESTVPSYKYQQNDGRQDIRKGVSGDDRKYFQAWTIFWGMAREVKGVVSVHGMTNQSNLEVDLYILDTNGNVSPVGAGDKIKSDNVDCVAAVPKDTSIFQGLKNVKKDFFISNAAKIGESSSLV